MVEINNKKYLLSLFVTIFGLVSLISGTSYAILRGSSISTNEQIVKSGSVELQLTESFNNIDTGVSIMKDTDGLLQDTVYEFSIKNIGSVAAQYDLKLLNEAPSGQTAISDEYIRIGLEVNGQEMGPMGLSKVANVIDSNTINENEIIKYKMRIWFDKTKTSQIQSNSTKKAYLSLKVDAKQSDYTKKPSNTRSVYVYSTNTAYNSNPLDSGTYNGYCAINTNEDYNSCTQENRGFIAQSACESYIDGWDGAVCQTGSWTVENSISFVEDASTLNKLFYLKYNIGSQTEPIESYVCYVLNNNEYCLIGGDGVYDFSTDTFSSPSYEINKQILQDSFGTSNCTDNTISYECSSGSLSAEASSSGNTGVSDDNINCRVNKYGNSGCHDGGVTPDPVGD